LTQRSGPGELLEAYFAELDLNKLYWVGDRLLAHHAALETYLYTQASDLFALTATITLYHLTNTILEGTAKTTPQAQRGQSKEKRTACPLATLVLGLDGSGFPKRSEVYAGNISEPQTLSG
jgi:hypothetical protein